MAFYWGQGVGLPRNPPAFLLLPNTLKGLIPCDFWFMCCFGLAPPGKQAKAGFSFLLLTVTLSILQVLSAPWTDSSDYRWSEIIKNWKTKSKTERGREKHPQSFEVQKVPLAGADKALLQLCKIQKPAYYVLLKVKILFIQFLISPLRLKLSFCRFICLKLLFCKTSN